MNDFYCLHVMCVLYVVLLTSFFPKRLPLGNDLLAVDIVLLGRAGLPRGDDIRPVLVGNRAALDGGHGVTEELDGGVGGDLVELVLVLDFGHLYNDNSCSAAEHSEVVSR